MTCRHCGREIYQSPDNRWVHTVPAGGGVGEHSRGVCFRAPRTYQVIGGTGIWLSVHVPDDSPDLTDRSAVERWLES